jgi:thymidylate synthase
MRSNDLFLGLPFNIAGYALLLLLYAKESGLKPYMLKGSLEDAHIYQNHVSVVEAQLSREPKDLPSLEIPDENWKGMLDWTAKDFVLTNYNPWPKLAAQVAR